MVRLFINGQETTIPAGEYKTFGQLYEAFAPRNMVLKKLVVNDVDVPAHKVSELREAILEEDTTISLEFVTPKEFLLEILPGVLDYLNSAIDLLPKFADSIRAGDPKVFENLKSISESVAALESLKQSIFRIIKMNEYDFSDVVLRLNKIVKVMESNDKGMIANALQEDMLAVFKTYADFFRQVLKQIGGN